MVFNTRALGRFWYWIEERHRIYMKRQAGELAPWTLDPVLRDYFFCNVFRELDPGTVWLRQGWTDRHGYGSDAFDGPTLLFNIIKYRLFGTERAGAALGYQTAWDDSMAAITTRLLTQARMDGPIYTAAYMHSGGLADHVKLLGDVWADRHNLYGRIVADRTIQGATKILTEIPHFGPFMAYEVATDLRHTPVLDGAPDTMTWANPGPGSWRGLRRIFPYVSKAEAVAAMALLLLWSQSKLAAYVPPLEMRDIEHSLCEFDKYERASQPGVVGLRRYGVKA
jgi:hypothetical protein